MLGNSLIKNRSYEKSDFCKYIRSCEEGEVRCKDSYKSACYQCGQWSEPYFFKCHAGLLMWCVPIIVEEKQIGAILCEQVLLWKIDKFFMKELETLNKDICDSEELKKLALKLPIISPYRCKSIASMMYIFVNYLVSRYNKIFIDQQDILKWRNLILKKIREKKECNNYECNSLEYIKREAILLKYIRMGDKDKVKFLLPNILTDIEILNEFNFNSTKQSCIQLMVLISRAVIDAGVHSDLALEVVKKFTQRIDLFKNSEALFNDLNTSILILLDMIYVSENYNVNKVLKEVREYINMNYNKKITLDNLADNFFISKFYLSHIFKDEFNITINQYITRIRVEKSIELMNRRELSIDDILKRVGFSSRSHFTNAFKKIIGVAPGTYRKKTYRIY